jgi:hypothetical protein
MISHCILYLVLEQSFYYQRDYLYLTTNFLKGMLPTKLTNIIALDLLGLAIKQQNEWYALTRDIGKWQKLTELSVDMNLFSWLLQTEIDLLLSLKFANLQIIHSVAQPLPSKIGLLQPAA